MHHLGATLRGLLLFCFLGGSILYDPLTDGGPSRLVALPTGAEPSISPENAVEIAINRLEPISGGVALKHPLHEVEFIDGGVRFVPHRGPEWRYTLAEVSAGGEPLHGAALGPVVARENGVGIVEYQRGGLVERYVARSRSVEQQFVISVPPAQAGDLLIRGEVRSAGAFDRRRDGWVWIDDRGAVSLGDVAVVDASGRPLVATMEVTATSTTIRVDGGDLATAAYPVLIDPEIGTNDFRISDMGPDGGADYDATDARVAYNPANNLYLVVWFGDDNTAPLVEGEQEVFGQLLSANGAEIGNNDFRISDMGSDGDPAIGQTPGNLQVAYNPTANEFFVVWVGEDDSGNLIDGEIEVFGQRLAATDGRAVGANDFRLSDMGPDGSSAYIVQSVGGLVYNADADEYLVVWSGDDDTGALVSLEFEIYGQRITGSLGEYVLDGYGGLVAGGGSPVLSPATPYWGFDVAADLELSTVGYYVLDRFGGVHAGGGAQALAPATTYWGWNAAADLELGTTGHYVLDLFGGMHAGGAAPIVPPATPYWGFDVAGDLELASVGYYVLDRYGGVHAGGGAQPLSPGTTYWGWDAAGDLELTRDGYYVLDRYGGVHAGGGAPVLAPATPYWGFDVAGDLELGSTGYYVLDRFGGIHAGGGAPVLTPGTTYWGWDIARDLELQ